MNTATKTTQWALLATVGAGLLMVTLDNSILYTALPTLVADLGATTSQSLWIVNAYPVVMAGLLLGAGTLGDRIGHRRMFTIGLVIFGAASLLAAFAPSPELLIAARAVLAVGAAAMMPATLALIRVTFTDERERTFAIAIWGSISVIGAAVGPIVGGALLEKFWWGSVFLINVPVVVAALIATAVIAPPDRPDHSKVWDLLSSIQAMVGLVGLVLFIKELAHVPQNWAVVIIAALLATAGFVTFVRRQRTLADPLLDFAVFRNKAFSGGVLAAAFAMFTIMGIQLVSTQRFQLVEGFSPLESGLLVAAIAVGTLPTAMIGGAFLHVVGLRIFIAGGLGLGAIGVAVSIAAISADVLGVLIAGLVITGLGLGGAFAVASTAIIGNAAPNKAGMAASLEEVSYGFCSLSAVALLGSLVTLIYSATISLPDGAPASAGNSLSEALAVAGGDPAIVQAAHTAFDHAYLVTMMVIGAALVLGAIVTGRLLRAYGPGSASQEFAENH